MPENRESRDFIHKKDTKGREGGTAGGFSGGVVGGVVGWLVGAGALAIPGLGPFIAAGPIMGLLAGGGAPGGFGGASVTVVGAGNPGEQAQADGGAGEAWGDTLLVHLHNAVRGERA